MGHAMLQLPRIPELAQRDRFVRRAVLDGRVWTLADEQRATIKSQKTPGRTVRLFWSGVSEARRWAEALSGGGGVKEITLQSFAADTLPALLTSNALAGTDWVAEPIEAEIDPVDLQHRLKTESIAGYLDALVSGGDVFVVSGDEGPWLESGAGRAISAPRMSIAAKRADAERRREALGAKSVIADPITDFLSSTLPWAVHRGCVVAIEPITGVGPIDISASDLATGLKKVT